MSFTTFALLSLAVVAWRFARSHSDVGRILASLLSVVCLVVGLVTASPLVKSLVLLSVLLYPVVVEKHRLLSLPEPCSKYTCPKYASCPQDFDCSRYVPKYSLGTLHDRYHH